MRMFAAEYTDFPIVQVPLAQYFEENQNVLRNIKSTKVPLVQACQGQVLRFPHREP